MNPRTLAMSLGLSLLTAACERPPVVRNCNADAEVPCPNLNDPAGRIEGTVIYEGPSPPREVLGEAGSTTDPRRERALGRVVLLLFHADNPPPPTGSASSAVSFQTISAAQLFRDSTQVRPGIVRATIQYSFPGILRGGVYQLRAFYSRDEELVSSTQAGVTVRAPSGFHPLFGVRNLPVKDDVGGGAIVDVSAAIPVFQRITIGTADGTDSHGHTRYEIPEVGFVAQNVNVFIGRPFPTERPQFRVVTRETPGVMHPSGRLVTLPGPNRMTLFEVGATPGIASDHVDAVATGSEAPAQSQELLQHAFDTGLLPSGSSVLEMRRNLVIEHADSGEDVPAFGVQVGLPDAECDLATLAGVRCTRDPFRDIGFFEFALDLDENGTIDLTEESRWADAHPTLITTSPLAGATNGRLPWVYPLVIFSKLHDPTPAESELLRSAAGGRLDPAGYARLRTALNRPEALDPQTGQCVTPDRCPVIMFGSVIPEGSAANLLLRPWSRGFRAAEPFLRIAVIPIAIEIHGSDRHRDWVPIIPPGRPELIQLASRFLEGPPARCCLEEPEWVEQQTGIPEGRYAINLISAGGQAWTVPNELGEFAPANSATQSICGGTVCRAQSQATIIRVRDYERLSPVNLVCPAAPLSYCPPWGD